MKLHILCREPPFTNGGLKSQQQKVAVRFNHYPTACFRGVSYNTGEGCLRARMEMNLRLFEINELSFSARTKRDEDRQSLRNSEADICEVNEIPCSASDCMR